MGKKIVKAIELARKHPPVVVRASDPRMQRLRERVEEIRRQTYEFLIDRARELGEVLIEAAALLDSPSHYNRWLKTVGISRPTSHNYRRVARFASEAPGLFQRWRDLGPTKVYQLARLGSKGRASILASEGIRAMTDAQFIALCAPYVEKTRLVTGNMLASGLERKAAGMVTKMNAWQLPEFDDAEVGKRLKTSLLLLSKRARELAARL